MNKINPIDIGETIIDVEDPVRPRIIRYGRGRMSFVLMDERSLVRGFIKRNDEEQQEVDDTHEYV